MEIIIAISEGETLQQALRQVSMDVAGPFTLTIKTEEAKTTVSSDLKRTAVNMNQQAMKPAGKKRGRPKGSRNKKAKRVPAGGLEMKSGAWTQKESIWMANQPRPTEAKTTKIGRTKVSPIERLFAEKFGYRRTFKSLASKWNRMNKK